MVTFIRLYPIFAACVAFVSFDFARNLRRKGKSFWVVPAAVTLIFLISMVLWWVYRGDLNAEQWAKEWAALTFFTSTQLV